tara:strand:- start:2254 stop:3246 length:993 start_codon:yes stop_codon:yes gene_type:complete
MDVKNIYSHLLPGIDLSNILIPINQYDNLIAELRLSKKEFIDQWKFSDYKNDDISNSIINNDWILGICMPLISSSIKYLQEYSKPLIIGISGLPGSGKSTLGKVIEKCSKLQNLPLNVVSIDDFYMPANDLDQAMLGNPWKVPRGIPGSHSLDDIYKTLGNFLNTGELISPRFDKSLRNGYGDRTGWFRSKPKVLVIEGWFLGCKPIIENEKNTIILNENIEPPLSLAEKDYRLKIQESLSLYLPIWSMFSSLWHIKSEEFSYTSKWKKQQESNMLKNKGSSLSGLELQSFIRMISTSLPQESLQNIVSDVRFNINSKRQITAINTNNLD